jgi:uncharacterized OsmC-like protein
VDEVVTNGLAWRALMATGDAVDASAPDPTAGPHTTVQAVNRWIDGGHSRTVLTSRSHPADLPVELGGAGQGPTSTELLLHALTACVTASLVLAATALDVALIQVETEAETVLDHRRPLGRVADGDGRAPSPVAPIRVTVRVSGDAPPAQLTGLLSDAWSRSPIVAALSGTTPLHPSIEVLPS